jgi:uncharacterized protein (TIGR00730 family)
MIDNNLYKGIVAFGSARIPLTDPHVMEVEEIAKKCALKVKEENRKISFITGGGPSIMTAWLKGAYEVGGVQTACMAMLLPHERKEDQLKYCDLSVSNVFNTFEARKSILLEFAKCLIIFKGGFGTMDELFTALTLMKTKKIPEIPVFIYPADYYKDVLNFENFLKTKTINQDELNILHFVNSKEELLEKLYEVIEK